MLTSNLIGAGAQLPTSVDSASILMSDHGLWYLQSICHNFDITGPEIYRHLANGYLRAW